MPSAFDGYTKSSERDECDCAADTEGKWANIHSPGCASLKTAPMVWRPIETAPKDREIILGMFREQFVDPIVMNSIWIDGEERGCYWSDWQGLPAPTHWMPLNAPIKLDQ